jgi:aldehyde:ferredoxin oxidoreductase
MKMHGWTGNIATIDLDCGTVRQEKLPAEVARDFLGGRGLGASILCKTTDPKAGAFDAPLILAVGPLTGIAPMSGRHSFVTKSPLTGTIVDSAGFDAVVINGQSETPVYLSIDDHDVRIEDASDLWGLNVRETTKRLEERGKVACIGRAGEKCVRFANIMNDYVHACGRGGIGAVMGHKRLKAIVVHGSTKPSIADKTGFEDANREILQLLRASPPLKSLSTYGTPSLVNLINYLGLMPTRNFRDLRFDVESISGDYIEENYELKRRSCYKCSVACKHRTKENIEIPEYETIAMFGPDCDNSDFDKIMDANRVCNDYGMDTISCGSTIACHQELHGKTHGLSELASMIGEREGVGDELSTGSREYADTAGAGDASMTSKGMEIPGYDPRGALGQSLAYATSNRGACHMRAYMIAPEIIGKPKLIDRFAGKAGLLSIFQNLAAAMDSLTVCRFSSFALSAEEYSSILSAVTGIRYGSEDLLRVGERIWNLERIFNLRVGFTRADDTLPDRFFGDGGIDRGEFEDALDEYYRFRGWGMDGVPTGWKLAELGLHID